MTKNNGGSRKMQEKSYLNIAIDLGTESVKVVGAYKNAQGNVEKCFFADTDDFSNQPFSSLALYLGAPQHKWVFGQEINKREDYANIVRVKEMLYLLSSEAENDRSYYENEKHFPIFIFPPRPDQPSIKNGMGPLVDDGYTFLANTTPREMAREFFKALFDKCINKQAEKILRSNPHLAGVKYISVYPDPKIIKREYVLELERLIAHGANMEEGSPLITSISAPQAVAIGAYVEKMIKATEYSNDNDKTLIFDIGEKDISVAKVDVKKSVRGKKDEISICVEGTDGHEQALSIGGADIDSAIGEFAKNKTIEQNSNGEGAGIIQDYMSYRQQYRLLRYVKSAKKHLLHFDYGYVTVEKGLNYDVKITKDDFDNIIFGKESSVGEKIVDYIVTELTRFGNDNVKTVLLVGGGAASYHLCDYVEKKCKEKGLTDVKISVTDNSKNDISEYFSAIGAAMLEPSGLALKVVSAYAYGSYTYQTSRDPIRCYKSYGGEVELEDKVFAVWLNRGDELTGKASSIESTFSTSYHDYIYKISKRLDTTVETLESGEVRYVNPLKIGCRVPERGASYDIEQKNKTYNDERFERAKREGLKLIGNKDADYISVRFAVYNPTKRQIEYLDDLYGNGSTPQLIHFEQGIRIDNDGNVTLFYENCKEKNRLNSNKITDSSGNRHSYEEIIIKHDFGSFKIETN